MRKLNLQTQILNVLQTDSKTNLYGSGMTVAEIAKSVYKDGYVKHTKDILHKLIRQRMGLVVELAASNSITVFAVRKASNPKTPNVKSKIACWKIFNPEVSGMDKELFEELKYKKKNGESRTQSFKRLRSIAVQYGILTQEKYLELDNAS